MVSRVMYLARATAHSSLCFEQQSSQPSRTTLSSLGKMPTTWSLRLISPLARSIRLIECSLGSMLFGEGLEGHIGEHVMPRIVHGDGEVST